MPTVDYIKDNPDFKQESKDLSLGVMKDKENFNNILDIGLGGLSDLYKAAVALGDGRRVDTAQGNVLDDIAAQQGVLRYNNVTDEFFRVVITLKGMLAANNGTRPEVVEAFDLLTKDPNLDVYRSGPYLVDVVFTSDIIGFVTGIDQLISLFPLVTALRIIVRGEDSIFGFLDDPDSTGFGSVTDVNAGGGFGSLAFSTSEEYR